MAEEEAFFLGRRPQAGRLPCQPVKAHHLAAQESQGATLMITVPPRRHVRNRTDVIATILFCLRCGKMSTHRDTNEERRPHTLNDDTEENSRHGALAPIVTESPPNPLLSGMRLTNAIEGAVASFIAEPGNSSLDWVQAWEMIQVLAQDKVTSIERRQAAQKNPSEVRRPLACLA